LHVFVYYLVLVVKEGKHPHHYNKINAFLLRLATIGFLPIFVNPVGTTFRNIYDKKPLLIAVNTCFLKLLVRNTH
jgi:hypothetical protein